MFFISLRLRALCDCGMCVCDRETTKKCARWLYEVSCVRERKKLCISVRCVCQAYLFLYIYYIYKEKSASYLKEDSV